MWSISQHSPLVLIKYVVIIYQNNVVDLGFKPATCYTLSQLEMDIRSNSILQGIFRPDQQLKMSYDQTDGLEVQRIQITSNEMLQSAMRLNLGTKMVIYLEATFSPEAVTGQIVALEIKFAAMQSEILQIRSGMEALTALIHRLERQFLQFRNPNLRAVKRTWVPETQPVAGAAAPQVAAAWPTPRIQEVAAAQPTTEIQEVAAAQPTSEVLEVPAAQPTTEIQEAAAAAAQPTSKSEAVVASSGLPECQRCGKPYKEDPDNVTCTACGALLKKEEEKP